MTENVIVKENVDGTTVSIKPFNMVVQFNNDSLKIVFEGGDNNEILLNGNTKMVVDGDFYLASTGEMGLMTSGENINIDSLDANIHLNSRRSKLLNDLPESVEYRKSKTTKITDIKENHTHEKRDDEKYALYDMVADLNKRIKYLEQIYRTTEDK